MDRRQDEKPQYDMHEQISKSAEERIDLLAANLGFIAHTTKKKENRDGVDRWIQIPERREILRVDYKNDTRASKTGNVFVETVSVRFTDRSGRAEKPGWIYKERMDAVLYNIEETDIVLLIPRATLEREIVEWTKTYGTREIKNKGYVTIGVPVPMKIVSALESVEVFNFSESRRTPFRCDGSWRRWIDTPYKMAGNIVHPPDADGVIISERPDGSNAKIRPGHEQYRRWMNVFRGYMPMGQLEALLRDEARSWKVKTHQDGQREVYFGQNSWNLPAEDWAALRADDERFIKGLCRHILSDVEKRAMVRYAFSGAIEERAA